MKRIDEVYKKLIELYNGEGISAGEIATSLGLDRANVSADLNKLSEAGKVSKIKGKPVLFVPQEIKLEENILEKFVKKNASLFSAVEQAKAAILYPPKGMNMLILGDTGVGKSMFATLVHRYAIEMEVMPEEAPFITFNCADYANNPQLLLGQLFGSVRGAYTGADADKPGLIEKANGGILFLDEVHRLPPEGQEIFFTFMDKGTFRRLGETDNERSSKVLIVSATTENPDSTLLKTFTRRIPMIIRIPSLNERTLEERFNLVSDFMREESARLRKSIKVSVNTMRSLLSYSCPNNVGQLRTDIQLLCAKAYADFIAHRKEEIVISSLDIPPYIREGLYMGTEHRQIWNKLIGINNRYCIFDTSEENMLFEEYNNNESIYEMIDIRFHELKTKGVSDEELDKEMEKDIEDYFDNYIHDVSSKVDMSKLENIIEPKVIRVVEELISLSEERLGRKLSKKVYYGMAVHISNSIERVRKNRKIVNPQLNSIRTQYKEEFNLALDFLKIIDRTLDISMPIDEAGFLSLFLIYDYRVVEEHNKDVKVIVIAHGPATASSMVETANKLLGVNYAIGINAPIEEKPKTILSNIKNYIKEAKLDSDVLFLVDMGSFTTFGAELQKEFGIRTKTIPLVSTLHVLEATRKAMMGYTLEEVYKDTLSVNVLMEANEEELIEEDEIGEKLAIITICTTGEGSAITVKNMLHRELDFDSNLLAVIPINLVGKGSVYKRIKEIEKDHTVVCLVSSFSLDTKIPQFGLEDMFNPDAIKLMQRYIDLQTAYLKMGDTLEMQLKNISGKAALIDIRRFNSMVEEALNIKLDTNFLIGISFHMASMIDRLKEGKYIDEFENKEKYIRESPELYNVVKGTTDFLNKKYQIEITEDEICYIMRFFDYRNYIKKA
ncbi:sigma 54-interacting transcriptional regulator [Clostridium fungisolvens]|uniref:Transcriptional regulatory protein DagR n=1 Tax=Clostridium fungisolvens TaxID=1604897 RepID=A0A6V8SC93_9CLOT|nr:sigma-54-dependent transcriptional regulator [Clostridium fungisolvens]GFP74670.1 Transcriptional regulatory protein DagR [Clostridium fungisolvens]